MYKNDSEKGVVETDGGKIYRAVADRLTGRSLSGRFCTAVIVAAGNGTRMGNTGTPKQLLPLLGKPVLIRSAEAFETCGFINEIVIVTRKEDVRAVWELIERYGLKKVTKTVVGGQTRQESTLAGFEAADKKCDLIAFHDAARCLVTPEMIEKVFREALRHGAAIAACRATDTVKIENGRGMIASTPERALAWYAQTPQVFKKDLYLTAAYYCKKKEIACTDDASLAEAAGFPVRLVDCGNQNIKLTTPSDIFTAEAIIKAAEEESK